MGYRATLNAETLALEEWVELHVDIVLVQLYTLKKETKKMYSMEQQPRDRRAEAR